MTPMYLIRGHQGAGCLKPELTDLAELLRNRHLDCLGISHAALTLCPEKLAPVPEDCPVSSPKSSSFRTRRHQASQFDLQVCSVLCHADICKPLLRSKPACSYALEKQLPRAEAEAADSSRMQELDGVTRHSSSLLWPRAKTVVAANPSKAFDVG